MELKKQDKYLIENTVNKIRNGKNSNFLNKKEINLIISYLNKNKINYELYYPFHDAEYGIIYSNVLPKIDLIRIKTKNKIRHQDILGSIYSLNIAEDIIGDIIITDNYYVIVMSYMSNYIINNLCKISKYNVSLEKVNIREIENYKINYEKIILNVTSNRIDLIISKLINKSRNDVITLIKQKEIILNYDILTKSNYMLRENDTFSIHKYGKYKFINIIGLTKKEKLLIEVKKYL